MSTFIKVEYRDYDNSVDISLNEAILIEMVGELRLALPTEAKAPIFETLMKALSEETKIRQQKRDVQDPKKSV